MTKFQSFDNKSVWNGPVWKYLLHAIWPLYLGGRGGFGGGRGGDRGGRGGGDRGGRGGGGGFGGGRWVYNIL